MSRPVYLINSSLNGYIADERGNMDWTAPSVELLAFINDGCATWARTLRPSPRRDDAGRGRDGVPLLLAFEISSSNTASDDGKVGRSTHQDGRTARFASGAGSFDVCG